MNLIPVDQVLKEFRMYRNAAPSVLQAIGNTPLVRLNIDEAESRQMARRLALEEGIFAGTSSGMNVLGACNLAHELGPGHTVVTVAVDTGLKYLAGDLFGQLNI